MRCKHQLIDKEELLKEIEQIYYNDNNEQTLEYTDQDTMMSADETMIQKNKTK